MGNTPLPVHDPGRAHCAPPRPAPGAFFFENASAEFIGTSTFDHNSARVEAGEAGVFGFARVFFAYRVIFTFHLGEMKTDYIDVQEFLSCSLFNS